MITGTISGTVDQVARYLMVPVDPCDPAALIGLLNENHPAFANEGTNKVIRIKGFIMASFLESGMPENALPFILEELENARHPYLIAAAARAVRALDQPAPQVIPLLFEALRNLAHGDDVVSFERLDPAYKAKSYTSGYREVFETFKWSGVIAAPYLLQMKAFQAERGRFLNGKLKKLLSESLTAVEKDSLAKSDCCTITQANPANFIRYRQQKLDPTAAEAITLEDHNGEQMRFRDFFKDKPAVIAFFYTRCDNPNKCSMTITKLGLLQKQLQEQGLEGEIKIAAVSYDAIYDLPQRIGDFCRHRQMRLDDDCRGFRITAGFEHLKAYLDLGVNFAGDVVNKHTIELYLLDSRGKVCASMTRLQWAVSEVVLELKKIMPLKKRRPVGGIAQNLYSMLLTTAVAFFPKCPLCLMAYLSALGISGVNVFRLAPWLLPLIFICFGIHVFLIARRCLLRGWFIPLYISLTGIVALLSGQFVLHIPMAVAVGSALVILGAMLNSFSLKHLVIQHR